MTDTNESLLERWLGKLGDVYRENRLPLLSALIAGLLAHMYVLTNNLPNYDGIRYLFGKGETVGSGRWGLVLVQALIPNFTMPWLHGVVSLLMLAVAACLIVRMFAFKSKLAQILLPALILVFPSQIGNFSFMFVASSYALAFLLVVFAVWSARNLRGWRAWLGFVPPLTFALSIYQGYVSIAAGLLLLLLVKDILDAGAEDRSAEIFLRGLRYLLLLAVGAVLYRVSINLALRIEGIDANEYTNEALYMGPGLLKGIATAYSMFVFNLTSRYNMLIVSKFSRALHFLAFLLCGAGLVYSQIRAKKPRQTLLLLLCLLLLPLALCCLYLIIDWGRIHTLVLYGFVCLYVLVLLGLEQLPLRFRNAGKDLGCLALALVVLVNVVYANRSYLQLELHYESAYSLATTLVTQIRSLPGYREDMRVAVYDSASDFLEEIPELFVNDPDIYGVDGQILVHSQFNGSTEPLFFRWYLGANMPFAEREEAKALAADERTQDMPLYPNEGSIRIIDDVVYVKFSEYKGEWS